MYSTSLREIRTECTTPLPTELSRPTTDRAIPPLYQLPTELPRPSTNRAIPPLPTELYRIPAELSRIPTELSRPSTNRAIIPRWQRKPECRYHLSSVLWCPCLLALSEAWRRQSADRNPNQSGIDGEQLRDCRTPLMQVDWKWLRESEGLISCLPPVCGTEVDTARPPFLLTLKNSHVDWLVTVSDVSMPWRHVFGDSSFHGAVNGPWLRRLLGLGSVVVVGGGGG